jgi:hypothetical protein
MTGMKEMGKREKERDEEEGNKRERRKGKDE